MASARTDPRLGPGLADRPTRVRSSGDWQSARRVGLSIWVTASFAYLALGAIFVELQGPKRGQPLGSWWVRPFTMYAHFDAAHYLRIAQFGYLSRGVNDPNAAFFPGYPLAGRYLSMLVGMGHVTPTQRLVAFALLAWAGAAAASVLLWKWIDAEAGSSAATAGVVAMMAGPYALFFVASYSEGIFLAFALGAWVCARQGRWRAAGVLTAVATFTRVDGLFLLAGIVVMYLQDARATGRQPLRKDAATLPCAGVSLLAFFGWLRLKTGHWDAWSRAEHLGWQRHLAWPWQTLSASVQRFHADVGDPAAHFQAAMEFVFAGFYVLVVIVLARRRMWPEFTYVACAALALMTSSFYQSVPRAMIVAFPVYLLVGRLWVSRARWAVAPLAAASLVVAIINVGFFVRGHTAG